VPGVERVHLMVLPRLSAPDLEELHAVVEAAGAPISRLVDAAADVPGMPSVRFTRCTALPMTHIGKPDRDRIIKIVRGEAES
jgi:hypothetical protein